MISEPLVFLSHLPRTKNASKEPISYPLILNETIAIGSTTFSSRFSTSIHSPVLNHLDHETHVDRGTFTHMHCELNDLAHATPSITATMVQHLNSNRLYGISPNSTVDVGFR